jgi:hypothetical protein
MKWPVLAVMLWSAIAIATPKPAMDEGDLFIFADGFFNNPTMLAEKSQDPTPARIGFLDDKTLVDAPYAKFVQQFDGIHLQIENDKIGWSADKQVAWVTADVVNRGSAMGGDPPPPGWFGDWSHGVILAVPSGKRFHVLAYMLRESIADKDQAAILKEGVVPPKLARKLEPGTEAVVKLFEASIGDPKAFAASVSDREDSVLFGSDRLERHLGGKQIGATLAKWNLALKVRDGVRAGLAGPTVVWIAANVDATPRGGGKPTPYQLLTIYEYAGGAWKLVHASFAFFGHKPS